MERSKTPRTLVGNLTIQPGHIVHAVDNTPVTPYAVVRVDRNTNLLHWGRPDGTTGTFPMVKDTTYTVS